MSSTNTKLLTEAEVNATLSVYVEQIAALSGKYKKQALSRLEADNLLSTDIRKHVLDAFCDYEREIKLLLGQ